VIEPKLVKEIDKLIKEHGMFSSRSDFIRDAIRARLIEVKKTVLGKEEKEEKGAKQGTKGRKASPKEEKAVEEIEEYRFGGVH